MPRRRFSTPLRWAAAPVAIIGTPAPRYRFCIILFSAFRLVPMPGVVDVPVPGAEWFFTPVTGTAGGEEWFEVPLGVQGEKTVAARVFTREMDYLATDEFRGYLHLDFKACSDGCE